MLCVVWMSGVWSENGEADFILMGASVRHIRGVMYKVDVPYISSLVLHADP